MAIITDAELRSILETAERHALAALAIEELPDLAMLRPLIAERVLRRLREAG